MLKSALAALTVTAAALLSTVTATPSFAATTTEPLVIGPQVTITVSCPKDHHVVDHFGQLSCLRDRKHHKVTKQFLKPAVKLAPTRAPYVSPWVQAGAFGPWHHCWQHGGWSFSNWQ
jgi:hypothetical protein